MVNKKQLKINNKVFYPQTSIEVLMYDEDTTFIDKLKVNRNIEIKSGDNIPLSYVGYEGIISKEDAPWLEFDRFNDITNNLIISNDQLLNSLGAVPVGYYDSYTGNPVYTDYDKQDVWDITYYNLPIIPFAHWEGKVDGSTTSINGIGVSDLYNRIAFTETMDSSSTVKTDFTSTDELNDAVSNGDLIPVRVATILPEEPGTRYEKEYYKLVLDTSEVKSIIGSGGGAGNTIINYSEYNDDRRTIEATENIYVYNINSLNESDSEYVYFSESGYYFNVTYHFVFDSEAPVELNYLKENIAIIINGNDCTNYFDLKILDSYKQEDETIMVTSCSMHADIIYTPENH